MSPDHARPLSLYCDCSSVAIVEFVFSSNSKALGVAAIRRGSPPKVHAIIAISNQSDTKP
jgi:hypothetical protein